MNRFTTILIVPEKTSRLRKITLPSLYMKFAFLLLLGLAAMIVYVFFDYINVLGQITENKLLRAENQELRKQVYAIGNKMTSMENTLERISLFTTKLKLITNLSDPERFKNLRVGIVRKHSEADDPSMTGSVDFDTLLASKQKTAPWNTEAPLTTLKKLELKLRDLKKVAILEEQDVHELNEIIADNKWLLESTPSIEPTLGKGWHTSGFGFRISPFTGRRKFHEGLDIAAPSGTAIYTTAAGIVTFSGTKPGYGKTVIIDHGYGFHTRYGHNSVNLVRIGNKVKRGDTIARIGNTGRTTGSHVHYEVRVNGIPVNPMRFILEEQR